MERFSETQKHKTQDGIVIDYEEEDGMLELDSLYIPEILDVAFEAGIDVCLCSQLGWMKTEFIQEYCKIRNLNCYWTGFGSDRIMDLVGLPRPVYIENKETKILEKSLSTAPSTEIMKLAISKDRSVIFLNDVFRQTPPEAQLPLLTFLETRTRVDNDNQSKLDFSHVQFIATSDTFTPKESLHSNINKKLIEHFAYAHCRVNYSVTPEWYGDSVSDIINENENEPLYKPKKITLRQSELLKHVQKEYQHLMYRAFTNTRHEYQTSE